MVATTKEGHHFSRAHSNSVNSFEMCYWVHSNNCKGPTITGTSTPKEGNLRALRLEAPMLDEQPSTARLRAPLSMFCSRPVLSRQATSDWLWGEGMSG